MIPQQYNPAPPGVVFKGIDERFVTANDYKIRFCSSPAVTLSVITIPIL